MSSNRPPVWTKLERLSTEQQIQRLWKQLWRQWKITWIPRKRKRLFFWRTGLEWSPQHVTQFNEQQQQPKQQQYSISAINHVNEESTKPKIDVQHYSTPSDGIKPGGRLQHFYQEWTQTTTHQWPLSVVRDGYQIQFNSTPQPWRLKMIQLNPVEQQAVKEAVQKFLQADIIEVSPSQSTDCLSNFFTIQESTKRRPILDCQKINNYI
ncbi:hypothetical protein G6F46_013855 [Rhizopus delemar]|uniref:Uncharacterized protein n=2 Tax=Rhizopus TaxID=4842 RepID=A0A9P6XZS0_9FUNG|nr:hypothetical protein G6F55_013601 [Rhizopus delemar]KAG1530280.1 hypothetical protein G6F51_013888 [Rhizopus arrhizus]KAG1483501.1 hypothetical protein G6F54_013535 [Rhizopus delemar]KAG1488417.1 hypothetical protein G6F53_013583 [Rhizopus delemar]KAG1533217.1 hypothetical protein G6F49_013565 [Rhizopus delemar]